jgi:hypothetical protein
MLEYERKWSGPKEVANLEPIADHNLRFAGQTGTAGLGFSKSDPYIANPTKQQRRKKITETLLAQHEEDHIRHASCLVRQGVWTHWENVMPFDLSWPNLIYGPGPHVIAFVLNAQLNSLRTSDMLHLWFGLPSAACVLCDAQNCTLHHVLAKCHKSLIDGRYNWRHDSVLLNIDHALSDLITAANKRKITNATVETKKAFEACFVRQGEKRKGPAPRPRNRGLLACANDWKLLIDYDHRQYVFPPTICATNERPDIVLWSSRARVVILLELTIPAEEGVAAAQVRKEAKYTKLLDEIAASNFWKAKLLTLEVGARGLVATRTFRAFTTLGFTITEAKKMCKAASEVAARCSYAIYLAHKQKTWVRSDLIDLSAMKAEDVSTKQHIPRITSSQSDATKADDVSSKHCILRTTSSQSDAATSPNQCTPRTTSSQSTAAADAKEANIVFLQRNEIPVLYHFTDAANLTSIREHGLLSASSLLANNMRVVMNSTDLSRNLTNPWA